MTAEPLLNWISLHCSVRSATAQGSREAGGSGSSAPGRSPVSIGIRHTSRPASGPATRRACLGHRSSLQDFDAVAVVFFAGDPGVLSGATGGGVCAGAADEQVVAVAADQAVGA